MVLGTSVSLEAAKKTAPGKKPKKAKKDVPSTATLPELAQASDTISLERVRDINKNVLLSWF